MNEQLHPTGIKGVSHGDATDDCSSDRQAADDHRLPHHGADDDFIGSFDPSFKMVSELHYHVPF